MQMLQNPMVQQMMQSISQNPQMLQQMVQSNPMLQQMTQNNPMMQHMLSNPQMLQTMINPDMMQQMMQAMQGGMGNGMNGGIASPNPADTRPPEERFATQVQQLESMGFPDKHSNLQALAQTNGDVNQAINALLGA